MTNSINVISPYKFNGQWVFDDEERGLLREAFIAGSDDIIDKMVRAKDIRNAEKGFLIIFSGGEFPGYEKVMEWDQSAFDGNWYKDEEGDFGWLCPALMKYFTEVPEKIYVEVKECN